MRPFLLMRTDDPSGVSGTGAVAQGVEWSDGTVSMRWMSHMPSFLSFDSIEHLEKIHGHAGATRVMFIPLGTG